MLRDFVEKLKSTTSSASTDAQPAPAESSSSSARAAIPSPTSAALVERPLAPTIPQETSRQSVLGADVEIKGSIRFTHDLLIDGKVEGDVSSDGILTVGAHAVIKGEIKTRSVIVIGHMEGNITTRERCELRDTATLIGDISAGTLTIQEGATFIGRSHIGKSPSEMRKAPDQAAKPLQVVQGTLSEEKPAKPVEIIPIRQAA
jgi:cytoskeletal protein CcmA (bactofilin family)